jgi:hypothetical protein
MLVGLLAPLFAWSCSAADFASLGLKDEVDGAAVVARIHLVHEDPVISTTDPSRICGYQFKAKVTENLKGQMKEDVVFYSKSDKDFIGGRQDYLLFAYKYTADRKFFSANGDVCNPIDVTLFVKSVDQTVFPLDGNDSLIVGRISPFTPDNFIANKNQYISGYFIEDDRIYATVPLAPVLDAIRGDIKK